MQVMELTLKDMEAKLAAGATFEAKYEQIEMRARGLEDGAFAVVGTRNDQAVIVDGAAGVLNLLRVMEQYSPLEAWEVIEK